MPPSVYLSLKTTVLPRIAELYTHVGVPYEAPQKADHGDLDIIVTQPKAGQVLHEQVREALGATLSIPLDGFRTSNFAVPVRAEDLQLMEIEDIDHAADVFYQIDVHVCENKEDMDQYIFYHSYGDLGMLMGVTAKGVGLTCSSHGLKLFQPEAPIPDPPHLPLTSSFPAIFEFFSLSQADWERGFATQNEIFEWLMTSRFFDPARVARIFTHKQKAKFDRTMFYAFPEYVRSKCVGSRTIPTVADVQHEALVYFGKKSEFDAIVREKQIQLRLKEVFSGHLVMEWTGLPSWGWVKKVMDEVRQRVGFENWKESLAEMSTEDVKNLTIRVKEDLLELEERVNHDQV